MQTAVDFEMNFEVSVHRREDYALYLWYFKVSGTSFHKYEDLLKFLTL